jgi:hypothetical protein
MNRLKEFSSWAIGAQCDHEINFYVDSESLNAKNEDLNVAYILEPEEVIYRGFYRDVIANRDKFKYILTDKEEILNSCPNAVLFEFGTAWIQENPHPEKIFGVSTLIGFKNMAEGHLLRHELWRVREMIQKPYYFYASHQGGPALLDNPLVINEHNRDELFKYQFQIVIENKQTDYWFTEKLCDCLTSRVVPIYYGARKIGDYFDSRGIFQAESINQIINFCNGLDETTYHKLMPFIDENEKRVKKYFKLGDRITEKLKELFNETI